MNPRTTLILLVVTAILGSAVYLYEIRGGEARREAELAEKRVFPAVEEDDVRAIVLETSDDHTARLERTDAGWRVREPVDFPADPVAVDGIASNLAELESKSVIEEAQAPEVYGLAEGARVLRFETADQDYELRVGDKTPVGSDTYVTTGHDPRVFAVETFKISSMTRTLDDLRERRPLRFDREAIERIEASWPDGGVVLEKRDDGWHLVEPIEARADETTLDTFFSDLSFLRASGFLDEPPPDAELGLDAPAFRVVLSGGEQRFELMIGDRELDDGSYAARATEPSLYKVSKSRLEALPRRVVDYRFKELARFVSSDARRLELVFHDDSGDRSEVVTITAERGDAGWSSEPESLAAGKAARIVSELSRVRANDIVADEMSEDERAAAGLAPPRAQLRVADADGETLAEIRLGRIELERGLYAQVPDRPVVYALEDTFAEHVPVSLEALRNRFLSEETGSEETGSEETETPEEEPVEEVEPLP